MKTVFVLLTIFFTLFPFCFDVAADNSSETETLSENEKLVTVAEKVAEEKMLSEEPSEKEKHFIKEENRNDHQEIFEEKDEIDDGKNPPQEKEEQNEQIYTNIRINEVLPNPEGLDSGKEFIEIYNFGKKVAALNNWTLYDKTQKPYTFGDIQLSSGDYLILYNKKDFSFALNNSNEEIFLESPEKKIVSEYSYKKSSSGLSWNHDTTWYLEKPTPGGKNIENPSTRDYPKIIINEIFPNPSSDEEEYEFIELYNPNDFDVSLENWKITDNSASGKYVFENIALVAKSYFVIYRSDFSFALNNSGNEKVSLIAPNEKTTSFISYTSSREDRSLNKAKKWYWADPTPGKENHENPLAKDYPHLILSEVLPNPSGDENADEYIEIYNPNASSVDLKDWVLQDSSPSGTYTFSGNSQIESKSYLVIYRNVFSFALNNSNETLSLIAPNEKTINKLSYTSCREDVSYNYHPSQDNWRQSKYLTPGKENVYNNLPEIKEFDIDKKIYKDVYAEFEARAHDKDGEKLKVRWDFGDGRKSYLWKTRHKYTKVGVYHGTLRIQDESEEIIKKFTINVKKYPKHKIVITKIVPNPAGKDAGSEYLILKNESDSRINLKNWSIATGTTKKKIVNHPIYDDLYIKPGKTKTIKKKYCAISLPNKRGVIEIRRPNGSMSDNKKYGDKNNSIPDNASYEIIDDVWQWIIPEDSEETAKIREIISQALLNESLRNQKRLESEIAFAVINNHPEDKDFPMLDNSNMVNHLQLFFNKLFKQIFVFFEKQAFILLKHSENEIVGAIHFIKPPNNPCKDFVHIYDEKYTFCSENIAKIQ